VAKRKSPYTQSPAHAIICERYKSGETQRSIGSDLGLTGNRIGQILALNGLSHKDGGHRVVIAKNALQKNKRREEFFLNVRGCTEEQWRYLRGMNKDYHKTPLIAHKIQKNNAKKRGIPWELPMWEWWRIWRDSGKWEKRGRCDGEYVMARIGDTGSYSTQNVEIIKCNQNIRDYYDNYSDEHYFLRWGKRR
jgi:hypothetical protein